MYVCLWPVTSRIWGVTVDQVLQEDSEYLLREQGGFRNQGEYTFNGWRKIDIVLKFIIEPCSNTIV